MRLALSSSELSPSGYIHAAPPDIYSHCGGYRQLHETEILSTCACVSRRLAVPTSRLRDPSPVGTRDRCVPPVSGVGSQLGEVISDPQSEFRVSRSSLSLRPRDSPPSRPPAGQAAPRSERSHEKDTHYSKGIAVLALHLTLRPVHPPGGRLVFCVLIFRFVVYS